MNDFGEDDIMKIIYVTSAKNDPNFIRNLNAELHKNYSRKMIGEKPK